VCGREKENVQPILYLIQKEFRQIFRDPMMIRILFFMPLMQLFLFGYAVNNDLRNVRVAVLDQDNSLESRRLVDSFYASNLFIPGPVANNAQDLEQALLKGRTDITLWIPEGYSRDLLSGKTAQVEIDVDGKNSNLAGRAGGYASAILRQESERFRDARILAKPMLKQKVREIVPVTRFFYNPELETRFYMIPGIVVLVVTVISGMLTGMAVVREQEIGTLEQLMVTPITPLQLIIGKTLPFMLLSFLELGFAATIAVVWFKLTLVGSVPLLLLSAFIYLLVTLGGGVLASTVSKTQQQAMFTVWFFLVFGILTSGFFYPIDNMPKVMQYITYVNPIRYFLAIVRGLFLKGITFQESLVNLVPMAAIGLLTFGTAIVRFKKRVV